MNEQLKIRFFLEDVPDYQKKKKLYDLYQRFRQMAEEGELTQSSRSAAEYITNELNKEFGPGTASYEYSPWKGFGFRGGYRIKVNLPDVRLFKDILDSEGKLLPSRDEK